LEKSFRCCIHIRLRRLGKVEQSDFQRYASTVQVRRTAAVSNHSVRCMMKTYEVDRLSPIRLFIGSTFLLILPLTFFFSFPCFYIIFPICFHSLHFSACLPPFFFHFSPSFILRSSPPSCVSSSFPPPFSSPLLPSPPPFSSPLLPLPLHLFLPLFSLPPSSSLQSPLFFCFFIPLLLLSFLCLIFILFSYAIFTTFLYISSSFSMPSSPHSTSFFSPSSSSFPSLLLSIFLSDFPPLILFPLFFSILYFLLLSPSSFASSSYIAASSVCVPSFPWFISKSHGHQIPSKQSPKGQGVKICFGSLSHGRSPGKKLVLN